MKKKWLLYTGVALLMLGASDLCGQQKSLYNGNVRVALHTLEQRGTSFRRRHRSQRQAAGIFARADDRNAKHSSSESHALRAACL